MDTCNLAHTVPAAIRYYKPLEDGSAPYTTTTGDEEVGEVSSNWDFDPRIVACEDVRGKEDTFTLDVHGFQYVYWPARHTAFVHDTAIAREYYPSAVALVKELTGAPYAFVFEHRIRHRAPYDTPAVTRRQPSTYVHLDQTPASAAAQVRKHFAPAQADVLVARRFEIVHVWRPISNAALDWPLALCDARSVDKERDLVPVSIRFPGRQGESYAVRHGKEHRWVYLSGMTPEECVVFKCFDSLSDGSVATCVPHTAFADPSTPPDAPLRESIECRVLVFYSE